MGQNFDDYPGPDPKKHMPKDMQHSVRIYLFVS